MSFTASFILKCFWNSAVPWLGGVVGETLCRADGMLMVDRQLSFEDLVEKVSKYCKADLSVVQMSFTLIWTELSGRRDYVYINDNECLPAIYIYGSNKPELFVTLQPIVSQFIERSYELGGSSQVNVLGGRGGVMSVSLATHII